MAIRMYGIKNCDTVKKARDWLGQHGIDFEFHDYKVSGIDRDTLETWCWEVGWEVLFNRAGTTFRKLSEKEREGVDEQRAIKLMLAQPSMIKRPVLDVGKRRLVGFKPDNYALEFLKGK